MGDENSEEKINFLEDFLIMVGLFNLLLVLMILCFNYSEIISFNRIEIISYIVSVFSVALLNFITDMSCSFLERDIHDTGLL